MMNAALGLPEALTPPAVGALTKAVCMSPSSKKRPSQPAAVPTRKIYLCGPIMSCTPDESVDWRARTKERLGHLFALLDPMRRSFADNAVDSANEIVEFDLQDIREADLLLVNYSKPSIGTAMEVFFASHDLGKFVIAFSPLPFGDCSPWMVRYCTKILPDLETALAYIERHFR